MLARLSSVLPTLSRRHLTLDGASSDRAAGTAPAEFSRIARASDPKDGSVAPRSISRRGCFLALNTGTGVLKPSITRSDAELLASIRNLWPSHNKNGTLREAFSALLEDSLQRSGPIQTTALTTHIRNINWLPEKDRLPAVNRIFQAITEGDVQNPYILMETTIEQFQYLAPNEGDFPQPTNDQIEAFQSLICLMKSTNVERLPSLLKTSQDTLEMVCLGAEFYFHDGDLQDAVDYANREYTDRGASAILKSLEELARRCDKTGSMLPEQNANPEST